MSANGINGNSPDQSQPEDPNSATGGTARVKVSGVWSPTLAILIRLTIEETLRLVS
jgi:hypothetical protein